MSFLTIIMYGSILEITPWINPLFSPYIAQEQRAIEWFERGMRPALHLPSLFLSTPFPLFPPFSNMTTAGELQYTSPPHKKTNFHKNIVLYMQNLCKIHPERHTLFPSTDLYRYIFGLTASYFLSQFSLLELKGTS